MLRSFVQYLLPLYFMDFLTLYLTSLHPSCDLSFLSTEELSVSYYDFIVVVRL